MLFFLVVSSSVFAFWIFTLIFYLLDYYIFSKKRRIRSVISHEKIEMYAELEKSFYDRFLAPTLKGFSEFMVRKVPERTAANAAKASAARANAAEQLRKQLRAAGITLTVEEYKSAKTIAMLGIMFGLFILSFIIGIGSVFGLLLLIFSPALAILAPSFFIKSRIKSRTQAINNQLPEVMDLLSVSIEAGLGFDGALVKIAETIHGPLVDELVILNREIQMGLPRRLALKNFGECCDLKELKVFASSLAQAEQLGIPIKNVLNTQSAQIRTTRRQKAQEKGMKAPVKIMLPMVGCIFPVIFIILLGPTVVNLIKQFA